MVWKETDVEQISEEQSDELRSNPARGRDLCGLLGFGAAMNHSDICLVTPGGYSNPCSSYYRVALFAPLYPLSAGLMLLGALLTIVGYSLTAAGYSKGAGTKFSVPISKPAN